jgi:hypothetical protein
MDIDTFMARCNAQIRVLENMKKAIDGAIERAQQRLTRVKAGERIEDVFSEKPTQRSGYDPSVDKGSRVLE